MKPQPTGNDFAAFIGIDWADAKHDICLQAANAARRESSVLAHRPDAIEAWTGTLRQRFQGRPIAVCLELAKGPLVYALQKYDFLVLFPVNPATLAKYRPPDLTDCAMRPVRRQNAARCLERVPRSG